MKLAVPDSVRKSGEFYCIKVEFNAPSGTWKKGWMFEGVGITNADEEN